MFSYFTFQFQYIAQVSFASLSIFLGLHSVDFHFPMSIHWSDLRALAHTYQLKRLPLVSVFFAVTLSLASTQLRTLFILAFFTLLSYLFHLATLFNAMAEPILQYILGFGTWYGLGTLGEPPLTTSQPCDRGGLCLPNQRAGMNSSQDPMPAWLIVLFFALVSVRYIFSFLVSSPSNLTN